MRHLLTLALCLALAACGGGSDLDDVTCNPDGEECMQVYGDRYPFAFESVDANWQVFTFDATPRVGFVRIK